MVLYKIKNETKTKKYNKFSSTNTHVKIFFEGKVSQVLVFVRQSFVLK